MNYTQKLTFSMLVPTAMVAGAGFCGGIGCVVDSARGGHSQS
jgi:hypothetical protein